MSHRPLEYCTDCGEPTGRAGRGDDSLYAADEGPFCEECWDNLREVLAEQKQALLAERDTLKARCAKLVPVAEQMRDLCAGLLKTDYARDPVRRDWCQAAVEIIDEILGHAKAKSE